VVAQPPDPTLFLGASPKDRPRSGYLPFGGGRRICIGQSFALDGDGADGGVSVVEEDEPMPSPCEVDVRVLATGVAFTPTLLRAGTYQAERCLVDSPIIA
jgi:hypothetical protein